MFRARRREGAIGHTARGQAPKREAARLEGTGGPPGVGLWKGGVNPSLTPSSGRRRRFSRTGLGVRAVTGETRFWEGKALKERANPVVDLARLSPYGAARLRFPQPAK
jgi:hypothetical protein